MTKGVSFAIATALALSACAGPAPTQAELQTMQQAPQPTSEGAQTATKAYFEDSLFDPGSAQYRFTQAPTQGHLTMGRIREFGWFMCGEVNAKNRMGGYVGYQPFLVYFDPVIANKVRDGSIDGGGDDDLPLVAGWCRGLYGG